MEPEVIPAAMDIIKCFGVINGLISANTDGITGGFTAKITTSEWVITSVF